MGQIQADPCVTFWVLVVQCDVFRGPASHRFGINEDPNISRVLLEWSQVAVSVRFQEDQVAVHLEDKQ